MNPHDRIVTTMPMSEIWDADGPIDARRERYLSLHDLKLMVSRGPVEFLVANVGHPLKRIPVDKCFDFWKSEVRPHLVNNPDEGFSIEDFPGGYAYLASEWSGGQLQAPVVLLEMHH